VRVAAGHTHPGVPCDSGASPAGCANPPTARPLLVALWRSPLAVLYRFLGLPVEVRGEVGPEIDDRRLTSSDSGRAELQAPHYVSDSTRIYRMKQGLFSDSLRVDLRIAKKASGTCRLY
jgi:hypothetical protein